MATACSPAAKDDPMDLGPFLQEYVLQNPFSMRMPKVSSTICPFPPGVNKNVITSSKSPPPAAPALKTGSSPLPLQPVVSSTAGSGTINTQSPVVIKVEEEDPDFIVTEDTGKVVDTPKGHIGSNATFAEMLKANLLPPKHVKVRNWLLRYYCFIPSYGGWVSSEELLRDVKVMFSQMKSCVLSRIIRFTFPDSRKIVNKYGYFYEGLVRRPKSADFKNADLLEAVKVTEKGEMTVGAAAKKYKLTEISITNMRLWHFHLKRQGNGQEDQDPDTTSQSEEHEEEDMEEEGSDDSENTPVNFEDDPNWETTAIKPSERYPILRWKLCCRAKRQKESSPVRKRRRIARSQHRGSLSDEETRGRKSPELNHVSSGGDSSQDSNHGNRQAEVQDVTLAHQECLDLSGKVEIKEEPVDVDFKHTTVRDTSCSDSQTTLSDSSYVPNRRKVQNGRSMGLSQSDKQNLSSMLSTGSPMLTTITQGSRNERAVNALAEILSSRQVIQNLHRELEEKDEQIHACESELASAHAEISQLKNQVCHRESQLARLAEEFFQLSNQFMKVSHSFKQVIVEMEAKKN